MIGAAALLLAAAVPAADCPLARQPYSSRSPMAHFALDPAAKAALDRAVPDLVRLPPGVPKGALPPGFARITTPGFWLKSRPDGAAATARLDRALARVRVTPAAVAARCAEYDRAPPALPAVIRRPALLVFDKITGFRDGPSVDAASAAIREVAARRGWTVVTTANGAVMNARDLARFDAVLWNNVSGDALTLPQRAAFRAWVERGGGWAGVHGSGGDPVWFWDWYADELVGARFTGHPMSPQFQAARVRVDDPAHSVAAGLPAEWTMTDEWYSFARSPRVAGARVLLTLDEASYSPVGFGGADLAMGDHPIAWTRCVGRGRSFYSAIGHRPEAYREPHAARALEQGVAWAMGLGGDGCGKGKR